MDAMQWFALAGALLSTYCLATEIAHFKDLSAFRHRLIRFTAIVVSLACFIGSLEFFQRSLILISKSDHNIYVIAQHFARDVNLANGLFLFGVMAILLLIPSLIDTAMVRWKKLRNEQR